MHLVAAIIYSLAAVALCLGNAKAQAVPKSTVITRAPRNITFLHFTIHDSPPWIILRLRHYL
jgi:hypothetical protein